MLDRVTLICIFAFIALTVGEPDLLDWFVGLFDF